MVKASALGKNGRRVVLLGLEEGNIMRLREGKPIHIHSEELGFAGTEIIIILGKDTAELQKTLGPLIGPETAVRDRRNEQKN